MIPSVSRPRLLAASALPRSRRPERHYTPQVKNPFYLLELLLDRDGDLTTVGGGSGMAKGAGTGDGHCFRSIKQLAQAEAYFALTGHSFAPLITQMYIA